MKRRLLAPALTLALLGCQERPPTPSLVGDFGAPGIYALAGDTITVWRRAAHPDGSSRFQSYSISPAGTVEYLDEPERTGATVDPEAVVDTAEHRLSFVLPPADFAAIRAEAALLRPQSLGPADPVGGYGGEARPRGCEADAVQPRVAGIKFINAASWGDFVLQAGCASEQGREATAVMTRLFDRLARNASAAQPRQAAR